MSKSPVQIQQLDQALAATSASFVVLPKIDAPFTTIVKRGKVTDFSNDLLPRMGIERFQMQATLLTEINGESGPTGEKVYGCANDPHGRIRFVGTWYSEISNDGNRLFNNTTSLDYIEVTFYGTGFNMVTTRPGNRNVLWAIDGGAETGITNYDGTGSSPIAGRNYVTNCVAPIVANLALGLHTVKVRSNSSAGLQICGFEIVNSSSNVITNAGSAFVGGKKVSLLSSSSSAYNSGFESGTLGSRGGRVLVYLKSDGTIGKAVTPTNASSAVLGSADHTNEEEIGTHFWREFGAGRADDFSSVAASANKAFTLDDGTTTFTAQNALPNTANLTEGMSIQTALAKCYVTFVGTGLDACFTGDSGTRTDTVHVNGTNIGTITSTLGKKEVRKIISGLPYGTHTVAFQSGAGAAGLFYTHFIAYGPKKPALPAGAIELADYNIMGNFAATTAGGIEATGSGMLYKANTREHMYYGTWSAAALDVTTTQSGFTVASATSGSAVELVFFGTGFEWFGETNTAGFSATNTVSLQNLSTGGAQLTLNSTNFPGLTVAHFGGGATFTYASGNLAVNTASTACSGFALSGLSLSLYRVRFQLGASASFRHGGMRIITPIHVPKLNGPHMISNTLSIGSQGVNDCRAFGDQIKTPNMSVYSKGIAGSFTTTSTSYVAIGDTATMIKTNGNPVHLSLSAVVNQQTVISDIQMTVYVDGVDMIPTTDQITVDVNTLNKNFLVNWSAMINLSPGYHCIQVFARTATGTFTIPGNRRNLTIMEVTP